MITHRAIKPLLIAVATAVVPLPSGFSHVMVSNQEGFVPEGTVLALRMESSLSSETSKVGDAFVATVIRDVTVNGHVIISSGSRVEGHVTVIEPARRMSRSGTIAVEFDRLILTNGQGYRVYGNLTSLDTAEIRKIGEENRISGGSTTTRSVVFIGGGAGVGAVVGVIAGGGKGAAVGAGVGAAAGTAAVLLAKGHEAIVEPGTEFGLELAQRIDLSASSPVPGIRQNDLSSTEMIRQAQRILREKDYYAGAIDGILGPRTERALRDFQRDNGLSTTGELDGPTAIRLGLIPEPVSSEQRKESRPIRVLDASAERWPDNSLHVKIQVETPTGGWRTFSEHSIVNDQLHVWARGIPPAGIVTQAIVPGELEVTITKPPEFIRDVIIHGATSDLAIKVELKGGYGGSVHRKMLDLTAQYEQKIQVNTSGDLWLLEEHRQYTESEIGLLLALKSLTHTAESYALLNAATDQEPARRAAVRALLFQANEVEGLVRASRAPEARSIAGQWATLENDLNRIASPFGLDREKTKNR